VVRVELVDVFDADHLLLPTKAAMT
jgi:hypothetical protein